MKKSIYAPWLIHFYQWYWREKYGDAVGTQDFCHFGRVVFFWAPLYWFLNRRLAGGMRPWMAISMAAYLAFLAQFPAPAIFAGAVILALTSGSRIVAFAARILNLNLGRRIKVWQALLFTVIVVGLLFYAKMMLEIFLSVSLMMGLLAAVLIFFLILMVAACVGVGIGVMGLDWLLDWMDRRPVSPKASAPVEEQILKGISRNVSGAFSTAWNWLAVMKHRTVCPFVSFKSGRIEFVFGDEPEDGSL